MHDALLARVTQRGPSITVGGWVAWILVAGAVVGAILVIVRSPLARPVRWAFRQLVGTPITRFFTLLVDNIVERHVAPLRFEMTPNGGSSMYDKVGKLPGLEEKVDKLVRSADDSNARIVKIEHDRAEQTPRIAENNAKLDALWEYAHQNIHEIREGVQLIQSKNDATVSVVGALEKAVDELKQTRRAIDGASDVVNNASAVAADVLAKAKQ